ncbi:MAG: hypothetical protein HXY28_03620 [Hydrogenophilaceae bacterium]|jgi:hypothetical protein|nr:hypothetical protein [Hydrogenophilaceae bacterium]
MFILRWPLALVLFGYCLLFLGAATGVAADRLGLGLDSAIWDAFVMRAAGVTWIETALWAAAGIFLFISGVRLIRRTQGFWAWLLGFACYGVRWGLTTVKSDDNIIADAAAVRTPEQALETAVEATTNYPLIALLALLIVGLLILIVDTADKRWSRRG